MLCFLSAEGSCHILGSTSKSLPCCSTVCNIISNACTNYAVSYIFYGLHFYSRSAFKYMLMLLLVCQPTNCIRNYPSFGPKSCSCFVSTNFPWATYQINPSFFPSGRNILIFFRCCSFLNYTYVYIFVTIVVYNLCASFPWWLVVFQTCNLNYFTVAFFAQADQIQMYMAMQHQTLSPEVTWNLLFNKFLIWVEGAGIVIQLFVPCVLPLTIQRELLNTCIQ